MFDYYRSIGKSVNPEVLKQVEIDVRNAGASVIAAKGATFYAIALSVSRICECVLRDSKSVMTVSSMTDGIYGTEDVCLSLPYVVGADGIISRIKVNLTPDEDEALRNSSKALKAVIDELEV
jgi:L-lactate dehydrogenase